MHGVLGLIVKRSFRPLERAIEVLDEQKLAVGIAEVVQVDKHVVPRSLLDYARLICSVRQEACAMLKSSHQLVVADQVAPDLVISGIEKLQERKVDIVHGVSYWVSRHISACA